MKKVVVHTDGACRGNPGKGGYGVVLEYQGHCKELSQGFERTTNNRMELLAAIVALEALKEPCQVELHSDSKYLVHAMTKGWIEGWKARGWARGPKREHLKNADLWKRLDRVRDGHRVEWKWVRGHAGHSLNERCDRLATRAADKGPHEVDEGFERETATPSDPGSAA